MSKRACIVCGVSIEGRHKNAKTCSQRCLDNLDNARKRAASAERWSSRSCAVCGASLEGTPYQQRTCVGECKRQYQRAYARSYHADHGRLPQTTEARKAYMRDYTHRNADALREKKAAYRAANRDRLREAEKDRLSRDGDLIRERARERYTARRAALKLVHEIETKGLEALL